MRILSIVWETCSTASVMIDGRIVACVSEERFTRRKNDELYPRTAIEAVLAVSGLRAEDVDLVAFAGERFDPRMVLCRRASGYSVADRLREQRRYWYPTMYEGKKLDYLEEFRDKVDTHQFPGRWDECLAFLRADHSAEEQNRYFQQFRARAIFDHLGIAPEKVVFPHHHFCHAAYALYGAPGDREDVLVLTADAWGDDMNASVNVSRHGRLTRVAASTDFNLARMYRSMTLLLGMKPDEHEYKVMGLAPYAKAKYYQPALEVFRNTLYVDGLGAAYHERPPDLYVYFQQRLEGSRFDAIAGALQQYAEELISTWTRNAVAATGTRRVRFGGGLAMNVKAMMELTKLPEVDDLFVCPSPSDDSLGMGAAYAAMYDVCVRRGDDPGTVLEPLADAYLGPDLEAGEIEDAIGRAMTTGRYRLHRAATPDCLASILERGAVLGRCVGRSEFGARALGNRSILADPRRREVVEKINRFVKSRDFWMPFAPSVLEERSHDYLVNPKGIRAPYMTIAFETTARGRGDLAAGLHPADHTCRPQVVTAAANPAYHALLRAFEARTGVGGVLNTSFNIHGEPIIQTAADAVDVLERSDLDGVVIGGDFLERIADRPDA